MSELKPGDRVLTVLEMVVVKPSLNPVMIFGAKDIRPGENAWKLPFDDATVERLARAGYERYWQARNINDGIPPDETDVRHWCKVVRAMIAALIGEDALRRSSRRSSGSSR